MNTVFPGGAGTMSPMAALRMEAREHLTETDAILMPSPIVDHRGRASDAGFFSSAAACHHLMPDCQLLPAGPCSDGYASDGYAFVTAAPPSCVLVKSEQQALPSPPLGPGDFDPAQYCHDLPAPPSAFGVDYPISPMSPDDWPPPVEATALLQHHGGKLRSQMAPDRGAEDSMGGMYAATSAPSGNLLPATQQPLGPFSSGYDAAFELSMEHFDPRVLSPEELLIPFSPPAVTPKLESPPGGLLDMPEAKPESARPLKTGAPGPDGKLDEPYAKLIYRAFMSRPDHAMTLQDIYQWFRDNTNKAVTEKGGWQNSIRHNLSMNAAFTKRHRKENSGDFRTILEDAKRTNEWVLEDWAVCYGVQSTTRYRKGNSRKRTGARATSSQPPTRPATRHSAKRAMSGRKGGCAARDSRLRDRACYRRKSTRPGLERGCLSPPRSTGPDMYCPDGFAPGQIGLAAHERGRPAHRGYGGGGPRPGQALLVREVGYFPLPAEDVIWGQGMANMDEYRGVAGVPSCYGDQASATYGGPVQDGFPYGGRDVQLAYPYYGHKRVADDGRLPQPATDGLYDWSDSSSS
ncbi:hypothetical protein CDD83_5507 [Cordyceps sp. RAO-2017]|nr:hypothetical protein CDD83_5507 [Cordyceps sp. RAO-2017]